MNLPLFPDPPAPDKTIPDAKSLESPTVLDAAPMSMPSAPLSIRDIAGLIHDRMRTLTAFGPRIVHAQWLRPSLNAGSRGFLSVTLADARDTTVAIDGFIWERADTDTILRQGQAFGCDLCDREARCEVMLEVTIDFWVKKTKPYLRIHRLNQIGMKGLRQQQREATLKRLEQEGLLVRNKALVWRRPTLRVLCIGKRESDGSRDVLSILKRSGFRFEPTILNVAVQGIAAVPTLLAAFAQLAAGEEKFDAVLLIRGGGSELDLVAYDDYEVAKAVALCRLPVVTGLGHTTDHSMCDLVSFKSLETPTAAARFFVDQIQTLQDRLRLMRDQVRACALKHIADARRTLLAQRPEFVQMGLSLVHDRQRHRLAQWHALDTAVRHSIQHSRRLLHTHHQAIPLEARRVLQGHQTLITDRFRAVVMSAPVVVSAHRHSLQVWRRTLPLTAVSTVVASGRLALRRFQQHLHQAACDRVRQTRTTLHRLHAHIQAASPERYFALGLSYVTRPDGTVVQRRSQVSAGDRLAIHVRDGRIDVAVTNTEPTHDD